MYLYNIKGPYITHLAIHGHADRTFDRSPVGMRHQNVHIDA